MGAPPPAQPVTVSDGQLGQVLYALGELRSDVAVIKTKLEDVPDHEQRIRDLERHQVSNDQLTKWQAQLQDERAKAQIAKSAQLRAMWAAIAAAATAVASLVAAFAHH